MLVLSRQRDESVIIGDEIEVTVVDVRGEKVRLGIRAPRSVSVHRKEIYDAIRRENQSAGQLNPADLPPQAIPPVAADLKPASPPAHCESGLSAALDEAKASLAEGGLPIGAALVEDGKIIASGHDRRVQSGDPAAEAAVECLRDSHRRGGKTRHGNAVLYCTHPVSEMGAGAVLGMGVRRVVVGDASHARSASDRLVRQGLEVSDLHDPSSRRMVEEFLHDNEPLWRRWQG